MLKTKRNATCPVPHVPGGRRRWWLASAVAGLIVIIGGVGYRSLAAAINAETTSPIRLDPPLRSLPLVIGDWHGANVPLSEGVLAIAGNDDFVSRTYRNAVSRDVVSLYVAYTARPRTMLGHRPRTCYASAGWTLAGWDETTLKLPDGSLLPVRIQHFFKAGVSEQHVVVLNYYVLCGTPTIDEHSFWSIGWRTPNLARDASRYVAQVQISAPADGVNGARARLLQRFASATAPEILALLPPPTDPTFAQ